jgi:hypothetical protein
MAELMHIPSARPDAASGHTASGVFQVIRFTWMILVIVLSCLLLPARAGVIRDL